MTTQQLDLNGDNIVSDICKKIHYHNQYYLSIGDEDIIEYYRRYLGKDGTIIFEPINEVK